MEIFAEHVIVTNRTSCFWLTRHFYFMTTSWHLYVFTPKRKKNMKNPLLHRLR